MELTILKKIFKIFENRTRLFLIIALFLILMIFSSMLKQIIVSLIFIFLASISKIYHRFFKSTLSLDLVFFVTITSIFSYKNIFLSLTIGIIGLILADIIGTKFSYTSLVSIFAIIIVIFLSNFFIFSIYSAIILMIIYEVIASFFYYLLGSSKERIIIFFFSHFLFNFFLIINFLEKITLIIQ